MRFSLTLLITALASLAIAQNPFLYNPGDLTSIKAGTPFTILWAPSTGTTDTVTLLLRQGNPNSLVTVMTIAANMTNTGAYIWSVPSTLVNGDLYTFEIYDDINHDLANYSNQFSIVSSNTVSSVIAAPVSTITTNGHVTTIYATASVMSSATKTGTVSGTATVTGSGSGSSSASATATGKSEGTGRRVEKVAVVVVGVVVGVLGGL